VRPYFLPILALLYLYACSNASGISDKGDTTAKTSASSLQPVSSPQPDSPSTTPDPKNPPRESSAQTNLRLAMESTLSPTQENISLPPFGLDKVMATIRQLKSVDDTDRDGFTIALSDSALDSLSFEEEFTYNMIHAESYSQMCDPLPEHPDEKDRIYSFTVNYFGEYDWSHRQNMFFQENRVGVERLMKAVIDQQCKVGMNFLDVIVSNNSVDMIPYLIDVYRKDNSNHYILSTLMLLMKENKYPEFLQSISYKKLYDQGAIRFDAYLNYNKANEDLIIQRATNFYNSIKEP
jgi:hypothetical protein